MPPVYARLRARIAAAINDPTCPMHRGPTAAGEFDRMPDVKLIALDAEDLRVLSCHLQDAVIRVGDMAYLKSEMRFAAIANRFDWEAAAKEADGSFRRRRAGLQPRAGRPGASQLSAPTPARRPASGKPHKRAGR